MPSYRVSKIKVLSPAEATTPTTNYKGDKLLARWFMGNYEVMVRRLMACRFDKLNR